MIKIISQPKYAIEEDNDNINNEKYSFPIQSSDNTEHNRHSRNKTNQYTLTETITTSNKDEDNCYSTQGNRETDDYKPFNSQRLQLLNEKDSIHKTHIRNNEAASSSLSPIKKNLPLPTSSTIINPSTPLDKKIWLKCTIEKVIKNNKETYILSNSKDNKPMLHAIRTANNKFDLCSAKTCFDHLAVMKHNFIGTQFSLYTNYDTDNRDKCNNVCSVIYEMNIFGMSGPNKRTVLIPKKTNSFNRDNTLIKCYEKDFAKAFQYMRCFTTLRPQYDNQSSELVLDYGEHKIAKSVKNFQLVEIGESDLILQFARMNKYNYILDFTYPLSPLQALFIAISSIEKKIACE